MQAHGKLWKHLLGSAGFIIGSECTSGHLDKYVGYVSSVTPARWGLPPTHWIEIDLAFLHFVQSTYIVIGKLRSVIGVINWAFLLRRSLFSTLHATYGLAKTNPPNNK